MSQLSITTTQNVNINFNAASIGERMLAHLIDFAVKVAYGLVVYYVIFVMMGLNDVMEGLDYWSAAAITVLFMLPVFFYSLVQESLWEGKTIGKYVMKMRVIKIDGYQAGFGEYLIRWIMRIIDGGIAFGLIGLITMMVSNKVQRLGDMAAGTAVISLRMTFQLTIRY
ncbi:MAG TPA: RDD family protein [Flavobacterium sp.]|nr:RDD family protein [Flavobacterium sp.]